MQSKVPSAITNITGGTITSTAGIFDTNITIKLKQSTRLDKEFENGLEVYRLPMTDYTIDYYKNSQSLFNAIEGLLRLNSVDITKVKVSLYNPSLDENADKNSIEKKPMMLRKSSFTYLHDNGIPSVFQVCGVEMDNDPMECTELKQGVLFILSFLNAIYGETATSQMEKFTREDEVGVDRDSTKYLGFMQMVNIPGTKLYLYTNGMIQALVDYTFNILNSLSENPDNVNIMYYTEDLEIEIDEQD